MLIYMSNELCETQVYTWMLLTTNLSNIHLLPPTVGLEAFVE